MTIKITSLGLGAIALTGMLAASSASAQTAAVADPQAALTQSVAFTNAINQIRTTYKTQLDQAESIRKALGPQEQVFDTNKDGQLDEQELARMRAAPNFASIQQQEQQAATAELPALRARAYVIEQLSPRLQTAFKNVLAAKRISLVVRPEAVLTADNTANITDDITAEMNKNTAAVSITPPANWQPGQAGQAAAPAAPVTTPTPAPTGTRRTR
ncbi:MAG: OmpH family outer membrane protein [Sphingomonas sp.]|uniref:OmpH family outer membrane protein n=1 Tax=Sphingomonas sp. TaxID=28214 RepID=UPI001AD515BC|nr:OmpH family outer membrane protein [Sphingomonas sp.]MBN8807412.1 OmpH family outer membrane protein [Sphingomonas sp.]